MILFHLLSDVPKYQYVLLTDFVKLLERTRKNPLTKQTTDSDHLDMVESVIRARMLSLKSKKYTKANNKTLPDCDENKKSS